jgi:hypothetical protein
MDVEHHIGDVQDTFDHDNGQHRLGSSRCFLTQAAPTILGETVSAAGVVVAGVIEDYQNDGTAGEGTLVNLSSNADSELIYDVGHGRCWIDIDGADGVTNDDCTGLGTDDGTGAPASGGTNSCCTDTDVGTCDLDDNKLYVFLGVAGDGGSAPTGGQDGWIEVMAQHDDTTDFIDAGRNVLFNGDFDHNGCTGTDDPTGWTSIGAETVAYEVGAANQGAGCAAIVTDGDGADGYSQVLSQLKGSTTYRVTAQVKEADTSDICTLSTANADTDVTGMVSVGISYTQLEGFFITGSALDDVTLSLISTATGDICTWDHITVYRDETVNIPESGVVGVFDTYTTSPGTVSTDCVGSGDPTDCCTGAGTGTCEPVDGSFVDVPELSITFVPPTPGWTIQIGASISMGCDKTCNWDEDEGFQCRLEKGGSLVAGTLMTELGIPTDNASGPNLTDYSTVVTMTSIENNPTAGTSIVYTVACSTEGDTDLDYNFQVLTGDTQDSQSNLWMMAYPPH